MWVVSKRERKTTTTTKNEYKITRKKEAAVEFKLDHMTLHKMVKQTNSTKIAAKTANFGILQPKTRISNDLLLSSKKDATYTMCLTLSPANYNECKAFCIFCVRTITFVILVSFSFCSLLRPLRPCYDYNYYYYCHCHCYFCYCYCCCCYLFQFRCVSQIRSMTFWMMAMAPCLHFEWHFALVQS